MEPVPALVPLEENARLAPAVGFDPGVNAAVGGASTVTVWEIWFVCPSVSVTVRVTVYVPGAV